MKNSLIFVSSLVLATSLAACKNEAEQPKPAESARASGNMSGMPMAEQPTHGMSTGTVTAVDAAKGKITLDHGAITALDWQPMTMSFSIQPEQASGLKAGDKVSFEIDWDGQAGTITKIEKSGS